VGIHTDEGLDKNMSYTEKVTFTGTNRYGTGPMKEDDVYTIAEFKECVSSGAFIDYDGHGYPVKDGYADKNIFIKPSGLNKIPADATHIVWYNR